jgi:thioesterase domain-containing protein
LQSLGLEAGENPHKTVEEMAGYYLRDIQAFQPEGPYLLGGQCFGGLVAFEMARQLKDQGEEVALLAIIDTEIPPRKGKGLFANGHQKSSLIENALQLLNLPWKTYVFFRKTYKRTRATRMWAHKNPIYLLKNMAIWRRYADTLQAHLDARQSYVVSDPYPGKISLLKFSTSHHEPKEGLWLWDDLACGGINVQVIPADDTSRAEGLFSERLRQWLEEHLEEAQTE